MSCWLATYCTLKVLACFQATINTVFCVVHSALRLSAAPTFFSSFSEAEGETPRMSYSLVSTTLAMVLTGCTARPSAEVQLTEESRRRILPTAAVQGYQIPQHANTHSETTRHKHPLNLELNKTVGRGAARTAA